MIRFSTLPSRGAAVLLIGSLLVLGGCHRGASKDSVPTAQTQSQFDMTIKAYKSGQFLIDGAVLSALDAGSHFAYLKDTGRLPKTVLLVPSDDSKIRKQHLQYMARLQLDYGFVAYYDDGGKLARINPVETKARALEDYHAPATGTSSDTNKDAAGTPYGAAGGDQSQSGH
ncbi:hypothetical protein [Dyella mobilis]|uniref:Uncharacterized protein n=1 Tax=Dyella mobilis TaxID=1849582 RepID=A0ABS2KJW9_9GAMM|nr:hypothetical protein [Dyella mobilis]MBM7131452.1 hypothetical protein [Dyella mobilis]GLQ96575.1 hypothetical protein GCM10007863_09930 [Dyella mobilis]